VITNLVDNAIKYSREEKQIHLELKNEKNKITLSVKDQGIGITKTDKQKIFHKFFRAGNEETRKAKGTGLGLYIVKYIVHHHHGKVIVKDNTPKGSIFEVHLYAV
jgi:signal transduction histidine kinase